MVRMGWTVQCAVQCSAYLCASSRVLGRAASDQLCVARHEVFVDAHVFLFREDGVVGFEAVFLE